MHQEASQLPEPMRLDYAARIERRRHSFFSVLSVAMALVTVSWLWYVQFVRPRYHRGGPFWEVLWDWSLLPGAITLLLAIAGLHQESRKGWLSFVAIAIALLAYLLMQPPYNFA